MPYTLKYRYISPFILEIVWPAKIRKEILLDMLKLKAAVTKLREEELLDTVMGYHSLSLHFKSAINFPDLLTDIERLEHSAPAVPLQRKRWYIPVCYGINYGKDLKQVASNHKLDPEELVAAHQGAVYLLYFYGFIPGFMYLGGLPRALHTPRKSFPDRNVEKGSVAIGGMQTGIYPSDSPGGWWVIGKTPVDILNLRLQNPLFAQPGDEIRFEAIDPDNYQWISEQVVKEEFELKSETVYG